MPGAVSLSVHMAGAHQSPAASPRGEILSLIPSARVPGVSECSPQPGRGEERGDTQTGAPLPPGNRPQGSESPCGACAVAAVTAVTGGC